MRDLFQEKLESCLTFKKWKKLSLNIFFKKYITQSYDPLKLIEKYIVLINKK